MANNWQGSHFKWIGIGLGLRHVYYVSVVDNRKETAAQQIQLEVKSFVSHIHSFDGSALTAILCVIKRDKKPRQGLCWVSVKAEKKGASLSLKLLASIYDWPAFSWLH